MEDKPIQPLEYQPTIPLEPFGRNYRMSAFMTGVAFVAFPPIAIVVDFMFMLPIRYSRGGLLALQLVSLGFSVAAIIYGVNVQRTWWKACLVAINGLLMGLNLLGACMLIA